ncbi:MAG: hypothetical protein PHE24_05635 [Patescibacteria group bacterium]|nr:hypothetical protein [Patescibacteria group bacterium]
MVMKAASTANLFMVNNEKKARRLPAGAIFFVFLLFVFLFFRGSIKIAQGLGDDPTANVAGYAWSSNFGWISMNCSNNNSCAANDGFDYGVNINTASDGNQFNLDGHAWSPNAGWISFTHDTNDPPDYKFNTSCKSGYSCTSGTNCTACYNPDDGNLYGWAKVVALGDDGWISLGTTSVALPYRVSIDRASASGTFSGFAWNGSTVPTEGLGWISFNCNNPPVSNQCGTSSYAVYLKGHHMPAPTNLWPSYPFITACSMKLALGVSLQWNNGGISPTYYNVIVSSSTSTSSPPAFNSGVRVGPVNSFTYAANIYNQHYYWWVKIWDDFGFASAWRQFDITKGDSLTDNVAANGGNPLTFTTYQHEMPIASFTYLPLEPLAYNSVTTTDASEYFASAPPVDNPYTAKNCNPSNCSWFWSGTNLLSNSTPNSSSTVMVFNYGDASMRLRVTDNEGYACTSTVDFFSDLLPVWKEKQAQ